MVYLLTGQKGSGKTQKMIELANQKAKACDGNQEQPQRYLQCIF